MSSSGALLWSFYVINDTDMYTGNHVFVRISILITRTGSNTVVRGSYLYQVIGDPKFADRVSTDLQNENTGNILILIMCNLGRAYNIQCSTGHSNWR